MRRERDFAGRGKIVGEEGGSIEDGKDVLRSDFLLRKSLGRGVRLNPWEEVL